MNYPIRELTVANFYFYLFIFYMSVLVCKLYMYVMFSSIYVQQS